MTYAQFFFTLFCQVAFCLGLNKILSEGELLWFLRKPFATLQSGFLYYLAKPVLTCITCFASVWGGSVFISLNGISVELLPYLIITCVSSAYLQTVIYVKNNI